MRHDCFKQEYLAEGQRHLVLAHSLDCLGPFGGEGEAICNTIDNQNCPRRIFLGSLAFESFEYLIREVYCDLVTVVDVRI